MPSYLKTLNIAALALLSILMHGCPDATETAKTCAEEVSELQDVCPVGTSALLRAEASGDCEGSGSADFLSESGELAGSCKTAGRCDFVCLIQPDRCECGVESFTNNEVICKVCAACGDGMCSDDETPETCPRDCAAMCEAGTYRCSGEGREQCSTQGSWEFLPCPEGETCRESNGAVTCGMTCVEGATRCNGEDRQQCSLQGIWETLPCAEGERCLEDMDGDASCQGACEAGVYRCDGAAREQCNALGQWDVLACPEGERCVADGETVSCRAACPAGESRCDGDSRETCSEAGEWETLACPEGQTCVQADREAMCEPIQSCGEVGSYRCFEGAREACTGDGLWAAQPCNGETRCDDASGDAICAECMEQWWADDDGDGFGDPLNSRRACEQPVGFVAAAGAEDCDDGDRLVNPDQREICDRRDNDCDREVDEVRDPACGIGEYCENGNDCRTRFCDVEFNVCVTGNLIVIGGGVSPNGSDVSGVAAESPKHLVRVSRAYLMQRREVTNGEWSALFNRNPSATPGAERPVQNVSFYDALAYANALSEEEGAEPCYDLTGCNGTPGIDYSCADVPGGPQLIPTCFGYRLPTEAEWEHASRGGRSGWFSGHYVDASPDNEAALDAILDPVGWYAGNSVDPDFGRARPHLVGTKDPTPNPGDWQIQMNDLYDTHGNVAEWTWDVYSPDAYRNRLISCEANNDCNGGECQPNGFCNNEILDPVHLGDDDMAGPRVVRGGAYDSSAFECRHAARRGADGRAHNIGFRLIRGMIQ